MDGSFMSAPPAAPPPYYDVASDNLLSDALQTINWLNLGTWARLRADRFCHPGALVRTAIAVIAIALLKAGSFRGRRISKALVFRLL
jgi:hypothetical protein